MDFALTDEQRMVLDTVRGFVNRELIPLEQKVQEEEIAGRRFPDDATARKLQAKARELGLWGLTEPEEHGGAGMSATMAALVTMETSRALTPFKYGGHVPGILFQCNDAQRQRYLTAAMEGTPFAFALTEPNAGSDASSIQTTARRKGDRWVINGTKTWISRGADAEFAIVFAVTDKEKGAKGGITAFLVDREAGWTARELPMMAHSDLAEAPPAELSFDDVEVGDDAVLGELGWGFKGAMAAIGHARIMSPSRAVGAAQRMLEMAVEYAKIRKTFGKPLAEHQAIQWMLADSAVELQAARWLILHAAWKHDQGKDTRFEESIAKLNGTQAAWKVVDRVLQIHGAMGYSKEMPIERVMRQLRVYRIYEGADELQKLNIARGLVKGTGSVSAWD